MPTKEFSNGVEALENKLLLITLAVYAVIVTSSAVLFGQLLDVFGTAKLDPDRSEFIALIVTAAYLGLAAAFFVTIVMVCKWVRRAHANLYAAGIADLEFTPRWAVIWYFIPIANLFKPYQAMQELWNTSRQLHDYPTEQAPTLVRLWWSAFIGSGILTAIGFLIETGTLPAEIGITTGALISAAGTLLFILSANMLLQLIRDITEAQRNGLRAAEIFGRTG